jgi:hypothetical protein
MNGITFHFTSDRLGRCDKSESLTVSLPQLFHSLESAAELQPARQQGLIVGVGFDSALTPLLYLSQVQ